MEKMWTTPAAYGSQLLNHQRSFELLQQRPQYLICDIKTIYFSFNFPTVTKIN